MSEYFDISPLISEAIAVFPGDQPFRRKIAMSFKSGDHLELSALETTVHLGAHADATNHYSGEGRGIDQRDIADYIGLCQVVRVSPKKVERISLNDWGKREVQAPRILFATESFPDPNQWQDEFNSLSPELIDFLAQRKVRLVGIDTPSVDPANSKALESHQALWRNQLSVLEGLVLTGVAEGLYTLVAPPLRLKDVDASPVRALLFPLNYNFAE